MSSSKEEEDEEMDFLQDQPKLSKVDMVSLMSCPAEDKVKTGSGLAENTFPHKIKQETTPPKQQAGTVNVMGETGHVTLPGQIVRVSNDNCSLYTEGSNANMSQEEKSTFDFISEKLNIMNSHSGEIATPIHKSNKQLCQEKITKSHCGSASVRSHSPFRLSHSPFLKRRKQDRQGMKGSSARKVSQKRSKKPRLETEGAKDRTPVVSESSSKDESFSDGLEIQEEESETELEQNLEMKARKNKLTAANVKSILLRVLTNEHVITMVRNTLREELASQDIDEKELPSAEYEPKMTRSKAKEVMKNEKNVLHPWTIYPLKKKTKNAPGFLELAFSEEEDDEDEEYNPEKDHDKIYSDEDTESILSSQTSELGSPCPSTPSTPYYSRTKDMDCTSTSSMTGTDDEKRVTSHMGPPLSLPVLKQRYFMKEMEKSQQSSQDEEEAEEQIASRTRSKFPLTEKSLTELEANFMAPDITADMYNTECDDKEWKEFLFAIHKSEEKESPADQEDDEEGDPEYNYLEDAEEEVQDREDFRSDRAVRVSKKELNELMDEMMAVYGDDADGEADMVPATRTKPAIKCQTKSSITECGQSTSQASSGSAELQLPQLTKDERKQLDEQMRKHVQLLTQTFIMAQGNQEKNFEAAECAKVFLNELFNLGKTSAVFVPKTAYQACNLVEACSIVNNEELGKCESSPVKSPDKNRRSFIIKQGKRFQELLISCFGTSETASPKPCLPNFSQKQTDIMWNSPVFMYHKLLPNGNFFYQSDSNKEKERVKFFDSEDNLLSLGLEQFRHLPLYRELIKKFLLPCKTVEQIKIRIKNLSAKKAPDNAVKFYRRENRTPDFPRSIVNFEPWMMRSPKDQMFDPYNSPAWCLSSCEENKKNLQAEIKKLKVELANIVSAAQQAGDVCSESGCKQYVDQFRKKFLEFMVKTYGSGIIPTLLGSGLDFWTYINNAVQPNQPQGSNISNPNVVIGHGQHDGINPGGALVPKEGNPNNPDMNQLNGFGNQLGAPGQPVANPVDTNQSNLNMNQRNTNQAIENQPNVVNQQEYKILPSDKSVNKNLTFKFEQKPDVGKDPHSARIENNKVENVQSNGVGQNKADSDKGSLDKTGGDKDLKKDVNGEADDYDDETERKLKFEPADDYDDETERKLKFEPADDYDDETERKLKFEPANDENTPEDSIDEMTEI